jgi:hypothetical protein
MDSKSRKCRSKLEKTDNPYSSIMFMMATTEEYKTWPSALFWKNQEDRRWTGGLTHSVQQRVNFNTLVLVFKMKIGMVPNFMQDELLFTRDATAKTRRKSNDLRLLRYQKTNMQRMIWHNGLRTFDGLPMDETSMS